MTPYVMALDQGTTSSRTIIFSEAGEALAMASQPLECRYPNQGWVEQDPEEIWHSQKATITQALEKARLNLAQITAIGITNQRETTIAWNTATGHAITPAIVWQCRRTADFCEVLKKEGLEEKIAQKTGLVTDPYFSGTKMRWIMENVPEAKALAAKNQLAFGTVDAWLIWNLTGGKTHATDITNASRTLLFNIHEKRWDPELMARMGVEESALPKVCPSSGIIAHTDAETMGASVPIAGVAGDQHAALFGQACFSPGMAKNTYGTGCFMLINTGKKPVKSQHGLLTTIAWQLGDEVTYALEGSIFIGGAAVQWLRDGLKLFSDAAETQALAESVADSGGVMFVPAFVGLGAPHWDPYARGMIIGLTRDTGIGHIVRATLEAIAFQSWEVLACMEKDTGTPLKTLRIDGGAASNNFLAQFQADILEREVSRPKQLETTALGAAFLAGLATGVWANTKAIEAMWAEEKRFSPTPGKTTQTKKLQTRWQKAVARAKGWAEGDG